MGYGIGNNEPMPCTKCYGHGKIDVDGNTVDCSRCGGTGVSR